MDNYPIIHSRPLPVGSVHHRNSHSLSDSSSSSFDHTAASPLAHKISKRGLSAPVAVREEEGEVSFELDRSSSFRDRNEEMKSLGLGWPSRFTTHPTLNNLPNSAREAAVSADGADLGQDLAPAGELKSRGHCKIANQSDTGSSGGSSPPPAYGRAPVIRKGSSNDISVHTPPTQDIEHGLSTSSSQEDAVEKMLDVCHSTITRRRRAVEAAASAFGLQLDSSPDTDRPTSSIADEAGERDIEYQIGELKRQLDARDKDLALTARMAQAILRRHEDLVAALPFGIKALIPELDSISLIDMSPVSAPPNVNGSPTLIARSARNTSPRGSLDQEGRLAASSPSGNPTQHAENTFPKGADHRRTKSAYTDIVFAEIRQQEADDRLAKMEQALADARDSEEAQRKNAARLSRDFQKLQRDYDRLEAQAVQATSDCRSELPSSPLCLRVGGSTPKRLRPRLSTSHQTVNLPAVPDEEEEVEAACGNVGLGLGLEWGVHRYPQFPTEAGPSAWRSPHKNDDSSVFRSPYTAKPERPTVLRLRRLQAAARQASSQMSDPIASVNISDRDRLSPACPPAPRLGTIETPPAASRIHRESRVASSRSMLVDPVTNSLFSPPQRASTTTSKDDPLRPDASSPVDSTVMRGRRPTVVRSSSILLRPAAGRTWMKDYITASVRRRTRNSELEVEVEEVDDEISSSETIGNASGHTGGKIETDEVASTGIMRRQSQASGDEGDDESIERSYLNHLSPRSGTRRAALSSDRASSSRQPSPTLWREESIELARCPRIKWADATNKGSIDRGHQGRRLLPQSPSPKSLSPPPTNQYIRKVELQTPTPNRRSGSRIKTSSSHRSLRSSEKRSHPYLRPLALPLAQGLRVGISDSSAAVLRQRRPLMLNRPLSDTAVLGHRRRISSPGRELMMQIELRQKEERHRRRLTRTTRSHEVVEGDESGVLSMPSKLINDLIIFFGLILEWLEVILVIVYRVFVQARNGQRPNGGQRMWAKRKRYYF